MPSPPPGSLAARYEEIKQLRAQADELEEALFREALESHRWLELPAARALGIPRTSLQRLLQTRFAALGAEAVKQRKAMGYEHGAKLSDVNK
jgi:DNA-binding NtrC family response regulator